MHLPAGTVTFLLTDIEGSTRLWESDAAAMSLAVARTYAILEESIARHEGVRPVEQGEGDSVVAGFSRASDALAAALDAQAAFHTEVWPTATPVRVRIALHTAEAQLRDEGNYFAPGVNRCARLRAIAHGGQTLVSRAAHDLVADSLPPGVELVDLGSHRLRDLGRAEQVFGATRPDIPTTFEPLQSLDALPNNLPGQLSSFVGRDRELEELRSALSTTRLLSLTGAGGCGKTRLALQTASDALDSFPDGAWWVELASLQEGELIASTMAGALGVPEVTGRGALEAAVAHLARRRALVILDNCEHVIAEAASVVDALLRGCPEITVIATSRAPLAVEGETDWRVPSLSLAADKHSNAIDAVMQSDAVRLFIERAVKVRPNFGVDASNAPAIAQICHDVDGIPLAIELAAARIRVLSADQIAAGLSDRFRLLVGGTRGAMPRQQTLRASVDWSHELLRGEERILFRRLAVFAGGWTLDAVEQVCSDDDLAGYAVLDLLTSLVDKSLVVADDGGADVRYRMLETVREYALDLLRGCGEGEVLGDRHLDYFLTFAELAEPQLVTAAQRAWLEVLDADAANLGLAIDRACEREPDIALRLCRALTLWWRARGRFTVAELAFGRALDAADPAPSALRARVVWGRAFLLTYAGDYTTGLGAAEEALALARAVGDESTMARALDMLGTVAMFSDPIGSRAVIQQSVDLARRAGDDWCIADASQIAGYSHLICDEFAEGERLLKSILPIIEQYGSEEQAAWHWLGLCFRPLIEVDAESFQENANRALTIGRDLGEPVTNAFTNCWLAIWEMSRGSLDSALVRITATEQRVVAAGGGMALPMTLTQLATCRAGLGELEAARTILENLVATGVDGGYLFAWALVALADVLRAQGADGAAAECAERALGTSERISSRLLAAGSQEILGRLAIERAAFREAEGLLQEALRTRAALNHRLYLPHTLDCLAEVACGLGAREDAARILGAACRARSDLQLVRWPPDQPRAAALEKFLRTSLGDDNFEAAHGQGTAMSLGDAIDWVRRPPAA